MEFEHKFVENIPDTLGDRVIYISIKFSTAVHNCFCGCGNEVVTPLSPTDWKLTYNGKDITLYPSIGNWSFDCQSHYWLENNKVIWARKWSKKEIKANRKQDMLNKNTYYSKNNSSYSENINSKSNVLTKWLRKIKSIIFKQP